MLGRKIEWTDKTLGKIATKRNQFVLPQEARKLRNKIKELEREKKKKLHVILGRLTKDGV